MKTQTGYICLCRIDREGSFWNPLSEYRLKVEPMDEEEGQTVYGELLETIKNGFDKEKFSDIDETDNGDNLPFGKIDYGGSEISATYVNKVPVNVKKLNLKGMGIDKKNPDKMIVDDFVPGIECMHENTSSEMHDVESAPTWKETEELLKEFARERKLPYLKGEEREL